MDYKYYSPIYGTVDTVDQLTDPSALSIVSDQESPIDGDIFLH